MKLLSLPPVAGPFVQSLRSIGYSMESAVADLIDNSISARAGSVEIFTEWRNADPVLAIIDDGYGMTPTEVQKAMQLGTIGPDNERSENDLGRFGMGLKTASFSQCKKLTLISRADSNDDWYGIRWDLDLVERENQWLAQIIKPAECELYLKDVGFEYSKGTAVIWNTFDRALDLTAASAERAYDRRVSALVDHLALTFHRFIRGREGTKKLTLRLNKRLIKGMDPFATRPETSRQASTLLSDETLRLGHCSIKIKAYLLPHPSSMTHSFAQRVSLNGEHHAGQGLYIYRAGRLISSGSWYRLARASEANKLARVQVDFDNNADHLWRIDVRKSRVDLPASLREQLRRVIIQCSKKSSTTFTRRAKMPSLDIEPVWQRVYDRDKEQVHYVLNRSHSALAVMLQSITCGQTRSALVSIIETALPLALIKNDVSATNIKLDQDSEDLFGQGQKLAESLFKAGIDLEIIFNALVHDSNIGLTREQAEKIINKIEVR
ncbi:ATP-binding protein [Motilimonas pumila]|uniref:ATP-binding protein n=2 Tax=Motilimonas pumila TaxID=2303987 RepID=A0A418YAS4_9GAMM|nr:ATP-binding protein [Motilimonas pumila]